MLTLDAIGTFFLEFWKREEAGIQFKWNMLNFQEEEVSELLRH
jgi:hypothetical protein